MVKEKGLLAQRRLKFNSRRLHCFSPEFFCNTPTQPTDGWVGHPALAPLRESTRPGKCTPQACMADNDLALGRIVQALSHSSHWTDTVIFVVEDDSQAGDAVYIAGELVLSER